MEMNFEMSMVEGGDENSLIEGMDNLISKIDKILAF